MLILLLVTPLHWAAWNGHTRTATVLVEKGAAVNSTNSEGKQFHQRKGIKIFIYVLDNTPLHLATGNGHTQCSAVLVERGASTKQSDNKGRTAKDLKEATNGKATFTVVSLLNKKMRSRVTDEKEVCYLSFVVRCYMLTFRRNI